ncbi:MAG TPA: hypothetical protein VGL95_03060 [Acetobacteraceae bacterium]|jgi:hypothetical protein
MPAASEPTISTFPSFNVAPGAKIAIAPSHTIRPLFPPAPGVFSVPVKVIVPAPRSCTLLTPNVPPTGLQTLMVTSAESLTPGTTPPTQLCGSRKSPGLPLPENSIVLLPALDVRSSAPVDDARIVRVTDQWPIKRIVAHQGMNGAMM